MRDVAANDLIALEAFVRELCRKRLERMSWLLVVIFAVAWIVGRVALHGQDLERPGRLWLGVLIGVAVVSATAFRFLPLAARYPEAFGAVMHAAVAWGGASHVAQMSDLNGPFFYVVYTFPALAIPLPGRLGSRVLITTAGAGTFVATYFIANPAYLAHPMIHVPLVCLASVSIVGVVMGLHGDRLVREHFLQGRKLERQRAELERHAAFLEREVDERTKVLGDLSDALETATASRSEVARALHDDLGQLVVGVRMELQHIERKLARETAEPGLRLDYLAGVVETLDRSVRAFIERLRAPATPVPLERALGELVTPLRRTIDVETVVRLQAPLPPREEQVVYRLVQEALSNALKHASPSQIRVRVAGDVDSVVVEVTDDGHGFDPERVAAGWGLRGMRERADEVGGELEVTSGAAGTTIRLRLPADVSPSAEHDRTTEATDAPEEAVSSPGTRPARRSETRARVATPRSEAG